MAMDFFELKNISEKFMEILNPISVEKILKVGEILGMKRGDRVIDFGCGYAEPLILWAEKFGISAIGIDIREHAVQRATKKIFQKGLADRIQIALGNAAAYQFEPHSFDFATCIGSTFIWAGFTNSIDAMKRTVKPNGKLAIGDCYWNHDEFPSECNRFFQDANHEHELLYEIWNRDCELISLIRANIDDWDNYEISNWLGMIDWIENNPEHPDRDDVIRHLHDSQDEYLRYGRKYLGWGIFLLRIR